MPDQKYRLVTRSDFDGLVCGMLLREADMLDSIKFVHPKDVQDGLVPVTGRDILTNLPYVPGCHLVVDHHGSEVARAEGRRQDGHVIDLSAPSAARVLYDHLGGAAALPKIREDLLTAVDKADSAQFTRAEILDPQGWVLLNFLMDPRTGLGRFREFRISNYELMMQLIETCRTMPVEDVLASPDVRERVDLYRDHRDMFQEQVLRRARVHGEVVVLDLRDEEIIYAGNRFMIYALFPQCTVSVHVLSGLRGQNTVFALGRSILNRTSRLDLGAICLGHGGGGHAAAATCQVANGDAERIKGELIAALDPVRKAA